MSDDQNETADTAAEIERRKKPKLTIPPGLDLERLNMAPGFRSLIKWSETQAEEAARILAEIKAMSEENATARAWEYTGYEAPEGVFEEVPRPWFAAVADTCGFETPPFAEAERVMRALFCGEFEDVTEAELLASLDESEDDAFAHAAAQGSRSMRTSDGDRPAACDDEHIAAVERYTDEQRASLMMARDELGNLLYWRGDILPNGRLAHAARATHSEVHRVLCGETYEDRLDRIKRRHRGESCEPPTVQMPSEHGTGCVWCQGGGR